MISTIRATPIKRTAVFAVGLACVCAALSTNALAATAVHYQAESLPALKEQLARHEVHAVSFHPGTPQGHIHASMNDGRHLTVLYATSEQAALVALARADGTPVAIAKAKPKAAAKPAHKLRYIAGGIVVLVIIVVAAVLLVDRRRKLGEEGSDGGSAEPPAQSSAGPG